MRNKKREREKCLWNTYIFFAEQMADTQGESATETMEALPHWQASLNLTWECGIGEPLSAPKLALVGGTICLGQLLTRVANSVLGHLQGKVLAPLAPFLGPNGMLLKELGVSKFLE